jgi:hypothetical protein
MPTAFKFMKKKFVKPFLECGTVRVGTALEFRKPDGLDAGRSDDFEMITPWESGDRELIAEVDRNHPFVRDLMGDNLPVGPKIIMHLEKGTKIRVQQSAFLLCASAEFSAALKSRMFDDFGADACVEIADIRVFAAILSDDPMLRSLRRQVGHVTYEDHVPREYRGHDPFKKRLKFAWQKEIRIAWFGSGIPNDGQVIQVPSITNFGLLKQIF